jgi:hypothetical protein
LVICRPDASGVMGLRSVHHDLGATGCERASHPEVVGMEVRDEYASQLTKADRGVAKRNLEAPLRFIGVEPAVDQ